MRISILLFLLLVSCSKEELVRGGKINEMAEIEYCKAKCIQEKADSFITTKFYSRCSCVFNITKRK